MIHIYIIFPSNSIIYSWFLGDRKTEGPNNHREKELRDDIRKKTSIGDQTITKLGVEIQICHLSLGREGRFVDWLDPNFQAQKQLLGVTMGNEDLGLY